MRAAPAEVLASPLIARKSQRIVIAIALIAPVKRRLTSQLDVNSALTRWDAHYVAEQSVPVQALVRNLSGFTALRAGGGQAKRYFGQFFSAKARILACAASVATIAQKSSTASAIARR